MARTWVYSPHSGGCKVPQHKQQVVRERILKYAKAKYAGKYNCIEVRFRGKYCYVDAYIEPYVPRYARSPCPGESRAEYIERLRNSPIHLCRLLYRGDDDAWSVAFYTYSHEKYEPSVFPDGQWTGTPEDAFDVGAMYLT